MTGADLNSYVRVDSHGIGKIHDGNRYERVNRAEITGKLGAFV